MNLDSEKKVSILKTVSESVFENLSLLIAHVFEIYFHTGTDISDINVSDKLKYLTLA